MGGEEIIVLSKNDQELFSFWVRFKHYEDKERYKMLSDFMAISGIREAKKKDKLFWKYYEQRYGIKRVGN